MGTGFNEDLDDMIVLFQNDLAILWDFPYEQIFHYYIKPAKTEALMSPMEQ
jgi:hypothetical protein